MSERERECVFFLREKRLLRTMKYLSYISEYTRKFNDDNNADDKTYVTSRYK